MFKKLKEKITEEVKSSPQRFQQITQSVSDRFQNSGPPEENYFSLTEDDHSSLPTSPITSNANIEPGFSSVPLMVSPQENRLRRNSNSSIASDVSFLPRYEAHSNMYHLQSDLDISASEMEDNASTSSQLGHLGKEQIYSAFQKSQMRYHKYRGRYSDLAKHYKELERENSKMKAVLVETQDKAIRRVTELKEQCNLEQKAKAHLESALRDELDEKQLQVEALKTKVSLLQNGGNVSPFLTPTNSNHIKDAENLQNLEMLTKYLNDARKEIEQLNVKIQEMKAKSIVFQSKEEEYKDKINGLNKEIGKFSDREKENNLVLAQNKMDLHNEMLSKEAELSSLRQENESLKHSLNAYETSAKQNTTKKIENLQSQNSKLIEKVESLQQKCSIQDGEVLKTQQYKIEIQNLTETVTNLKKSIEKHYENETTIKELTEKLSVQTKEYEARMEEIKKLEVMSEEYEAKVRDLSEDLVVQQKNYEEKLEEFKSLTGQNKEYKAKLEETLHKLEMQEKSYEELKKKLKDERGNYDLKIEETITRENNNKERIEEMKKRLDMQRNVYEAKIEELREAIEDQKNGYEVRIETLRDDAKKGLLSIEDKVEDKLKKKYEIKESELRADFEERLNQIVSQNVELKDLQLKIVENEDIIKGLSEENSILNLDLNNNALKYKDLEEQYLELSKDNTRFRFKVSLLKKEVAAVEGNKEKILRLQASINTMQKESKEMEETVLKTETEKRALEEAVNAPNEKISFLKVNTEKMLEEKFRELESDQVAAANKLNRKIIALTKELEVKDNLIRMREDVLGVNENETKIIKIRITELEEENIKLEKSVSEKTFECQKLSGEYNEKVSQINGLEKKLKGSRTIEEELSKLASENRRLCEEKLNTEQDLRETQEQLKLTEMKNESNEIGRNEYKMLQLELEELKKSKHELETKYGEIEDNKFKLEESYSQIEKRFEESQSLIEEKRVFYEDQLKKLGDENNLLKDDIKGFEMKLIECQNSSDEVKKLQIKFEELFKENKKLKIVLKKDREHLEKMKNELEEKSRRLEEILKMNEVLNAKQNESLLKIEQFESDSNQKSKEFLDLEMKFADFLKIFVGEKESLTVELNTLKEVERNYLNILDENQNLKEEISQVQTLQERVQFLENLENVKNDLEVRLNQAEEQVKRIGEEKLICEEEMEMLKKNEEILKALEVEKVENLNEIRRLRTVEEDSKQFGDEIESLRKKLMVLESDNREKNSEIKSLMKRLEELKPMEEEMSRLKVIEHELTLTIDEDKNKAAMEFHNLKLEKVGLEERLQDFGRQVDRLQKEVDRGKEVEENLKQLSEELRNLSEINDGIRKQNENLKDLKNELEEGNNKLVSEKQTLEEDLIRVTEEVNGLKRDNNGVELNDIQQNFFEIKAKCDNLFIENGSLKSDIEELERRCDAFAKDKKNFEGQINELERHYNEVLHEKQLLHEEVEELKSLPINSHNKVHDQQGQLQSQNHRGNKLDNLEILKQGDLISNANPDNEKLAREVEHLRDKVIQYKSLDLTNKSSIEFYEDELAKMKTKNDKLSRKLDETLVTLNHCAELSISTESEYLRNILYNYMLGKESVVLAKVIAAVCKFDEHQTDAVIQREQQKQTLLGQLGFI